MTEMGKLGETGWQRMRRKVKICDSLRESLEDALAFERGEMEDEKRDAIKDRRERISQTHYARIARMRRQAAVSE
jgi:hypothetical protein